ncbi:nucleotide-binding protein [Candidatus Micrarchaeota archaeon]|nr:nucleotide-binding protein [Candidatus Micrarchaeota archaeon]
MIRILLDTNFLLVPYQFKLDVFEEMKGVFEGAYSYVVPSGVIGELQNLGKGKGREGAAARFGLKLLRMREHEEVKSDGNVDEWILGYAQKEGLIVATNDRALREKLKRKRVKVVSLISRARIGIV